MSLVLNLSASDLAIEMGNLKCSIRTIRAYKKSCNKNFSRTHQLSLTNKTVLHSLNEITMDPSLILARLVITKAKISWIDQNRKLSTSTATITAMDRATNLTLTSHFCLKTNRNSPTTKLSMQFLHLKDEMSLKLQLEKPQKAILSTLSLITESVLSLLKLMKTLWEAQS